MRWSDLAEADEVFLTNAVAGVVPVAVVQSGARRVRPPSSDAAERLRARLALL
jgi:branched-subunit amino acid aminotransferase/4-amino-4-deoxychorismate lyase